MERPDVLQRDDTGRNSPYNFREHQFETEYMFSKDPDSPWWIGYKINNIVTWYVKSAKCDHLS